MIQKEPYTQEWHEERVKRFNEHECNHEVYCGQLEDSMESPVSKEAHEISAWFLFALGGLIMWVIDNFIVK